MENFERKLKIDNLINILGILFLLIFAGLAAYSEFSDTPIFIPASANPHVTSGWLGFISGAACGIGAMMVVFLIRNLRALKNKEKLKKLYIQEHDERETQIWNSARSTAGRTFLIFGMVIGIIAGFFNMTVSITILACIALYSFTCLGYMLYYRVKL